jgi:hypothetical protein
MKKSGFTDSQIVDCPSSRQFKSRDLRVNHPRQIRHRRRLTEGLMRTHRVVLNAPTFQNLLGLRQRIEQPGVEHFLSNATVKPLNKGILVRLTRLDIAQLNPVLLGPTNELR